MLQTADLLADRSGDLQVKNVQSHVGALHSYTTLYQYKKDPSNDLITK